MVFAVSMALFEVDGLSCRAGRGGCIASCQIQNCATGYCDGAGICRCSRCGSGQPWGKREVKDEADEAIENSGVDVENLADRVVTGDKGVEENNGVVETNGKRRFCTRICANRCW
jgi:hypothetical protein